MTNRTFTIIKPDAVAAGHTGEIIDRIISDGFNILAMKMIRMSRSQAENFYKAHRDRHFYSNLIIFMTSGPIVVALLEKENAVSELRKLVGSTDPAEAEPGTIRRNFGHNVRENAIHATDCDEHVSVEWSQFFTEDEICVNEQP